MNKKFYYVCDMACVRINDSWFRNSVGDGSYVIEIRDAKEDEDIRESLCFFDARQAAIKIYKYDCSDEILFEIKKGPQAGGYYLFLDKEKKGCFVLAKAF